MKKLNILFSLLTKKEKKKFFTLTILMIFVSFLEIASVSAFIPAISVLLKGDLQYFFDILKLDPLDFQFDQKYLIYVSLFLIIIVFLFKNIFLIFYTWFNLSFYFNVGKRLSEYLFNIYLNLPYLSHLDKKNSKLIFNTTEGIEVYRNGLMHITIMFSEILIFLGMLIFLSIIDLNSVLLLCILLSFVTLCIFLLNKNRNFVWGEKAKFHDTSRINTMLQSLSSIKDVKIKNIESFFIKEFNLSNFFRTRFAKFNQFFTTVPRFFMEFAVITATFLLIILYMYSGYSYDIILIKLGVFSVAAFRLYPSTFRIINSYQRYNFCMPVIEDLKNEISSNKNFYKENYEAKIYYNKNYDCKKIAMNGISFKYPNTSKWVINNLNLSLNENDMIGISGITGSGKTTLIDIITGLLKPQKGNFEINGIKQNNLPKSLIYNIAYVPQNIALINDTIEKNITFGDLEKEINIGRLNFALKNAQLENFISTLSNGLKTSIGERGLKVSGGEKQRIGIARALYSDKKILILDEATNALDKETENLILTFLKNQNEYKIIIIISHEKNTLKYCNRLYEFKGGILENYAE